MMDRSGDPDGQLVRLLGDPVAPHVTVAYTLFVAEPLLRCHHLPLHARCRHQMYHLGDRAHQLPELSPIRTVMEHKSVRLRLSSLAYAREWLKNTL